MKRKLQPICHPADCHCAWVWVAFPLRSPHLDRIWQPVKKPGCPGPCREAAMAQWPPSSPQKAAVEMVWVTGACEKKKCHQQPHSSHLLQKKEWGKARGHIEEEFIRAMTGSKQMGSVLTGSNQIHAKELGVLMQDFSQFTLKPNHIMCSISTLEWSLVGN